MTKTRVFVFALREKGDLNLCFMRTATQTLLSLILCILLGIHAQGVDVNLASDFLVVLDIPRMPSAKLTSAFMTLPSAKPCQPLRTSNTTTAPLAPTLCLRSKSITPAEFLALPRTEQVLAQWLISSKTVGDFCGRTPSLQRLVSCLRTGILFDGTKMVKRLALEDYYENLANRASTRLDRRNVFVTTILRRPFDTLISSFIENGFETHRNDGLYPTLIKAQRALVESDLYCDLKTFVSRSPLCNNLKSEVGVDKQLLFTRQDLFERIPSINADSLQAELSAFNINRTNDGAFFDFLRCAHNPALNRMTRMLSFTPCLNESLSKTQQEKLHNESVESAKRSLSNMPYFAIAELPYESKLLFEWTLGVSFESINPNLLGFDADVHLPFYKRFHGALFTNPVIVAAVNQVIADDRHVYEHALTLFETRFTNAARKRNQPSLVKGLRARVRKLRI